MSLNDMFAQDGDDLSSEILATDISITEPPSMVTDGVEIHEMQVENDDAIVGMESVLAGYGYVYDSIRKSGGMSRAIAQEAMSVNPDFCKNVSPLGGFTTAPTATNLRQSLEELSVGIWAAIAAAVAALGALIYKFVKWVKGRYFSDGDDTLFDADKAKEKDEASTDAGDALSELCSADAKSAGRMAHMSLDELVKKLPEVNGKTEAITKLMEGVDPIVGEILNKGAFYKKVLMISDAMGTWTKEFREATSKLADVVKNSIGENGEVKYDNPKALEFMQRFNEACKNKDNHALRGLIGSSVAVVISGKEYSMSELRSELESDVHNLSDQAPVKFRSIEEIVRLCNEIKRADLSQRINKGFGKESFAMLDKVQDTIHAISARVNSASKSSKSDKDDDASRQAQEDFRAFFKNVSASLSASFNDYVSISTKSIRAFNDAVIYSDKLVCRALVEYAAGVEAVLRDESVPANNEGSSDGMVDKTVMEKLVNLRRKIKLWMHGS